MTDKDIIKALELCIDDECRCGECPYFGIASDGVSCGKEHGIDMLNLINRQKAEIAEYQKHIDNDIIYVKSVKAEAIKEFAERLKGYFETYADTEEANAVYVKNLIDNLVKEMIEGK